MKKLTHPGNIVIIGFAIMVIMMSTMVFKCFQQDIQLTSKNYYEQELKYQDRINATTNANQLNENFQISTFGDAVKITIPAVLSKNLEKGEVTFYCISDNKQDRTIELKKNERGEYIINTKDWKKIQYKAKISIIKDHKNYYKELAISI